MISSAAVEARLWEALKDVEDPELPISIVDMGLVVQIRLQDRRAEVALTFTSMGCPAGPLIAGDMEGAVRQVEGIENVELELTFDPPWTPDRMSDDAKFILGFG